MDLIDLIDGLIGLALWLLSKFWYVLLALFGLRLLGRSQSGRRNQRRRDILTPAYGTGDRPAGQSQRRESSRKSMVRPEPVPPAGQWRDSRGKSAISVAPEQEAAETPFRQSEPEVIRETVKQEQPNFEGRHEPALDPVEGMKWALILSPPKAKAPRTMPPYSSRNR
ncbi:hypothetical protein [Brevibacillus fulvus]|uniref:Uncharacterized protein n=1 Tax=Brevibacillus fulvus TaxID=1125967 RepID=A0A938XY99_9BACL|nr:hypothetical protein [Brevibacillus fulvus]MBM7589858.1 hypothetical protein [Brevibacillus fulvus]